MSDTRCNCGHLLEEHGIDGCHAFDEFDGRCVYCECQHTQAEISMIDDLQQQITALKAELEAAKTRIADRVKEEGRNINVEHLAKDNERMLAELSKYADPDNWYENGDCENVFCPQVPVNFPWESAMYGISGKKRGER